MLYKRSYSHACLVRDLTVCLIFLYQCHDLIARTNITEWDFIAVYGSVGMIAENNKSSIHNIGKIHISSLYTPGLLP